MFTTLKIVAMCFAAALIGTTSHSVEAAWYKSGPTRVGVDTGIKQTPEKQAYFEPGSFQAEREGFEPSVPGIPGTTV